MQAYHHVQIVETSRARVLVYRRRLGSNTGYRAPTVLDVGRHAPQVTDLTAPRPDLVSTPLADGVQDGLAGLEECVAHDGVVLGRLDAAVGVRLLGQAVVELPVVDPPRRQRVSVLLLAAVGAGVAGAGEGPRVAVQAELQAQVVDLLRQAVHSLGELGRVGDEVARPIALLQRPAVVDVDVDVAQVLEAEVDEGLGGLQDDGRRCGVALRLILCSIGLVVRHMQGGPVLLEVEWLPHNGGREMLGRH